MAIKLNFIPTASIPFPEAYVTIGAARIGFFHETAEYDIYIWANEESRRQEVEEYRTPIKIITRTVPWEIYQRYLTAEVLSGEGNNPQTAFYSLAVNEGGEWGLKDLLEEGEMV